MAAPGEPTMIAQCGQGRPLKRTIILWAQFQYSKNSFYLWAKQISVAENKNLTLSARRLCLAVAQNTKSPLKPHWAVLCAARQKISNNNQSLVLVRLYEAARTYFISNV